MNFLKENRIANFLRLAKRAFRDYKPQIILLIGLGFLGGLLEGIGINAIIPLFSFVTNDPTSGTDIISRAIEKSFNFLHIPFELKIMLIFIAILFIIKAIASFFSKYITDVIKASYVKDTQIKLLGLTLNSSWSHLSKQKIGHLEKVLTNDVGMSASLLTLATNVTILAVNVLIYAFIAFNISPLITLVTFIIGGTLFLFFKPFVHRTLVAANRSAIVLKQSANHINESMIGIKVIKAMALEDKIVEKSKMHFNEWKRIMVRLSTLSNFTNTVVQPVSLIMILVLFAISYKTSGFEFASFAVIIYAINKIFAHIQQAQTQLHSINGMYPFLRTVIEYEDKATQHTEKTVGVQPFSFYNKIEFRNVSFAYEMTSRTINSVNVSINRGDILGIIGPSGSGKTTLVDLLLRLIKPDEGEIVVDGININTISPKEWSCNVGYVSQDIFLINSTIRNNITFYDESITDEDMIWATKSAHIYDFIISLPNGFDAEVGERGNKLSGGQKQRIALARVLARRPKILILDEATSALDNESQEFIDEAIESLRGEVTIFIIAHRPSTIMNADRIIVIEGGTISEQGKPKEMNNDTNSYLSKIATT